LGEVGIEGGYHSTLETYSCSCSCGVLRVLSDLEGDPLVGVVDAPHTTLMLEAGTSCLCRGVDPLPVGRGQFLNGSSLDEDVDGMFEYNSCGEGPDGGPLSFERDRRGGIVVGFAGHEELGSRSGSLVCASCRLRSYDGAENPKS
jgi:hypothetical protein